MLLMRLVEAPASAAAPEELPADQLACPAPGGAPTGTRWPLPGLAWAWPVGPGPLAEAMRPHNAAALMVEEWNHPAQRIYQELGMRYRPFAAAVQDTQF